MSVEDFRKGRRLMKRIVPFVIICGLTLSMPLSLKAGEGKIGYVDLYSVFNNYQKTKDYEKILEQKKSEKEKETKINEKKNEIIKMQDKLDLLKGKEQDKQREKINQAIVEYRKLESQIVSELKKESDARMKEIFNDVNNTISKFAKQNGFSVIINKNALLYGAPSMDVTEKIVDILNKEYKKQKK